MNTTAGQRQKVAEAGDQLRRGQVFGKMSKAPNIRKQDNNLLRFDAFFMLAVLAENFVDDNRVHVGGDFLDNASAGAVFPYRLGLPAAPGMIFRQERMSLHDEGDLTGKLLHKGKILPIKRFAAGLVDQLERTEYHPLGFKGHAKNRAGDIAGFGIHLAGPTVILPTIGDDQRLAAIHHLPGYALPRQEIDTLQPAAAADRHGADAAVLKPAVEPKGSRLGLQGPGHRLQYGLCSQCRLHVLLQVLRKAVYDGLDLLELL